MTIKESKKKHGLHKDIRDISKKVKDQKKSEQMAYRKKQYALHRRNKNAIQK